MRVLSFKESSSGRTRKEMIPRETLASCRVERIGAGSAVHDSETHSPYVFPFSRLIISHNQSAASFGVLETRTGDYIGIPNNVEQLEPQGECWVKGFSNFYNIFLSDSVRHSENCVLA